MKRFAILLVPVVLFAFGCSKSVKVCEKLEKLDSLPMGGVDMCQAKWNGLKEKDPAKYEKQGDCILAAADKAAVAKCSE